MTNEEKHKTPEEREKAFHEFCCKRSDCSICEARYEATTKCFGRDHCVLRWLTLEAGEELLPCPFCGGDAEVVRLEPTDGVLVQCKECYSKSMLLGIREEAIAAWNRRSK